MEEDLKLFGRRIVAVANTVAALLSALYFVAQFFTPGDHPAGQLPNVGTGVLAVFGAGVLAMNFLRLVYLRAGRRDQEGPLTSHTDNGTVQVSREAIVAALRSAGEAMDEVSRVRVQVTNPAKRRTLIVAQYLAPEGVPILDLSAKLRTVLRERFLGMVQLEKESRLDIEITFEGFHGKLRSPQPDAQKARKRRSRWTTVRGPALHRPALPDRRRRGGVLMARVRSLRSCFLGHVSLWLAALGLAVPVDAQTRQLQPGLNRRLDELMRQGQPQTPGARGRACRSSRRAACCRSAAACRSSCPE